MFQRRQFQYLQQSLHRHRQSRQSCHLWSQLLVDYFHHHIHHLLM
jgi:hypothetical protein